MIFDRSHPIKGVIYCNLFPCFRPFQAADLGGDWRILESMRVVI